MSILLKVIAIMICLLMLYGLGSQMVRKNLSESQAILWLIGVLILLILSAFPQILVWIAGLLGIWWAPASLIFFLILILGIIVLRHTVTLSEREAQITELAIQVSLLRNELESLKSDIAKSDEKKDADIREVTE